MKIDHVEILDVYTGELFEGNLCIRNKRIISLSKCRAKKVLDAKGMIAVPAFFDSHMHVEATMLVPWELARILIPHGTLELMMDPHEVGNVAGVEGIRFLVSLFEGVPIRPLVQVPSRVPSSPGLETAGHHLGPEEVAELLSEPWAVSLGELNYQNALSGKEEYLEKIRIALSRGKVVNGHAPGLRPPELDAYAALGIGDDHESVEPWEVTEKLRRGMWILVREGTTERNLEGLLRPLVEKIRDFRFFAFCTDDKHPNDIISEGHIDYCVRRAIELGVDPVEAIRMATINPALHFHLDTDLGSLAPHRLADVLLLRDLERVEIDTVLFEGRVVFRNGELVRSLRPKEIPEEYMRSVHVPEGLRPEDLLIGAKGEEALVRVIKIVPEQIVNREVRRWLPIVGGFVRAQYPVNYIAVIERHGRGGGIGKGFVEGFSLESGAIASTVAHDHHNLVVVGASPEDMVAAARILERAGGGFAVVRDSEPLALVPLPFLGLMSTEPAEKVVKALEEANEAARELGCPLRAPFMQLEFVTLPTVPDLGMTDLGLVDARSFTLVNPILETK